MAISGLPSQYSGYSMTTRGPTMDILGELFRSANDPTGLRALANELDRYDLNPAQVRQIVDMLTLPDGIEPPTHIVDGTRISYEPVSQHRLLDIVLHVTMFENGVQQLLDLAELCQCNGLHLCFLQNEKYCIEVSYPRRIGNIDHKMLYVLLPENPDTLCLTACLNKAAIVNDKLQVEQVKLIDVLGYFDKVDGYLIGHELSHATAFAICCGLTPRDLGNSVRDTHRRIETFFEAIYQQLTPEARELLQAHKKILIQLLRDLFQDGEEARNVLGLGINESFNRDDNFIVSEFDFLREGTGSLCTRMPYLRQSPTQRPKVCMALLTLIFKLKEQSINSSLILAGEMEALRITLEEVEVANQNLVGIQQQLNDAGYEIQPIRGDGNCGFYAILKALNPGQRYDRVQQGDPQWGEATQLRQTIADLTGNQHIRDMVTTPLGTEDRQMGFDALPAVAQHLNRPLVVINTTPDAQHPMFAYYNQNGNHGIANGFQAALDAAHNPVILLYRPGHWEAVVPEPPES
jgi:hypothetical protein